MPGTVTKGERYALAEELAGELERRADDLVSCARQAAHEARNAGVGQSRLTLEAAADAVLKEAACIAAGMRRAAILIRDPDRFLACSSTSSNASAPISAQLESTRSLPTKWGSEKPRSSSELLPELAPTAR